VGVCRTAEGMGVEWQWSVGYIVTLDGGDPAWYIFRRTQHAINCEGLQKENKRIYKTLG
jgi:hypothetical protein